MRIRVGRVLVLEVHHPGERREAVSRSMAMGAMLLGLLLLLLLPALVYRIGVGV